MADSCGLSVGSLRGQSGRIQPRRGGMEPWPSVPPSDRDGITLSGWLDRPSVGSGGGLTAPDGTVIRLSTPPFHSAAQTVETVGQRRRFLCQKRSRKGIATTKCCALMTFRQKRTWRRNTTYVQATVGNKPEGRPELSETETRANAPGPGWPIEQSDDGRGLGAKVDLPGP